MGALIQATPTWPARSAAGSRGGLAQAAVSVVGHFTGAVVDGHARLSVVEFDYPSPDLADDQIRLRRWEERDLDCIRLASSDPRIPEETSVPAAFSRAEGLAFIRRQWSRRDNDEGLSLAIEERSSQEAVGLIGAFLRTQPHVVGLGYWVVPPGRGNGYTPLAIGLLAPWLLGLTRLRRVEALVEPSNMASRRSLERCGFQEEGLLRSYLSGTLDVVMYSLIAPDLAAGR